MHGVIGDHDGFVDMVTEVGKGTTFRIYLPSIINVAKPVETAENEPVPQGTERVLIVDDEPGQRFLANKSMSKLGYNITEVDNGNDAVKLFTETRNAQNASPYDLVMLDMIMGDGFDGLETLNEILKLYPNQKVIIVSGHAEDGRSKAAQGLGAKWLAKPYNHGVLARTIRSVLDD